jgi:hypothetical protein
MKVDRGGHPEIALPRSYRFNQIDPPEEFLLGENINVSGKPRRTLERFGQPTVDSEQMERTSHPSTPRNLFATARLKLGATAALQATGTILTPAEFPKFQTSALPGYKSSAASAFDAIRPCFDGSGFFPYLPMSQQKRIIVRTSRISFRTEVFEYRMDAIEGLSIFLALVLGSECITNIVEVEMKRNPQGTWRPRTFHEYEWITDPSREVDMYIEVVAKVRIPSTTKPFALKQTLVAMGTMEFITYSDGRFHPPERGRIDVTLAREKLRDLDGREIENQDAVVRFHVSYPDIRYPGLPDDFVCPTDAACAFQGMRTYLKKLLSPFSGQFLKWSPNYVEPIMFREISWNDRALFHMCSSMTDKSEIGLRQKVRQFISCAHVLARNGPYVLAPNADSLHRATGRVAAALEKGEMLPEEKYKPFHTDELRHALVLKASAKYK